MRLCSGADVPAGQSTFTILGASGFIGATLVGWLQSQDQPVHGITRAALPALLAERRPVAHVIDCIGLTADFRERPLDTAEAHVGLVARCLAELRFASFLLLSSTRVYTRAFATHERALLPTDPTDPSDLYNVTKLAGEALCLADRRPTVRVARLSNVYGIAMPTTSFLGEVLHEGLETGQVAFHQGPSSAKDYISVAAVVRILPAIAATARHRLYNVATGRNTEHAAIARCLRDSAGWRTSFAADALTVRHRPIDTARLEAEFGVACGDLVSDLPAMLALAEGERCSPLTKKMAA